MSLIKNLVQIQIRLFIYVVNEDRCGFHFFVRKKFQFLIGHGLMVLSKSAF